MQAFSKYTNSTVTNEILVSFDLESNHEILAPNASGGNQIHIVTEKMIVCNHYSNRRFLLTPVISKLYIKLSISSGCTLALIDCDFRCSTFLDMFNVSISHKL
jgi:hypothetical protein